MKETETTQSLEQKTRDLEREIAVRKEMESRLILAMDMAEAANAAKSEFLTVISHELQTPMSAISASAQLLSENVSDPQTRDVVNIIRDAANAVSRKIGDLLDFARSDAGKVILADQVFNPREVITEWMRPFQVSARDKNLHLSCDVLLSGEDMLIGDVDRIGQIVSNLVDNALKFTNEGRVTFDVWDEEPEIHGLDSSEDRVCLHFLVADSGAGVPEEKLEQIFEPFNQLRDTTGRRSPGTGLGLAISRQLVEMMDGRIWAEAEDEGGSAFHFIIQLQKARTVSVKNSYRSWNADSPDADE